MSTTGSRIKERRMALGLSVEELADKLGKNRATVYRYESDEIENFPISIIGPLSEALQTTPAYLMGWEDDPLYYYGRQKGEDLILKEVPNPLIMLKPQHEYDESSGDINEYNSLQYSLNIQAIARAMGITSANREQLDSFIDYLRYKSLPEAEPVIAPFTPHPTVRDDGFTEIKVYDQPAAAGLGNYFNEPDYHVEQYPSSLMTPTVDFGVRISGDSMEPEISDGATVLVHSCPSVPSGRIGVFVLNGETYCKLLLVDQVRRQVRLVSVNPSYDDIIIGEFDELRTVGQVI